MPGSSDRIAGKGRGVRVDFAAVKRAVSIELVLAHYALQLRRQNPTSLRGPCPLPTHVKRGKGSSDRSFSVSTAKNVWACGSASCTAARDGKKGGNILDLVAALEGCSFREAALKLQEWFNITPPATRAATTDHSKLAPEKRPELERSEHAAGAGESAPEGEGNKPLSFELKDVQHDHPYLRTRGFEPRFCEYLGVGFFPGRGVMKGRIVFPIHSATGELVAYAGRAIDETEPRWLFPKGFHKTLEVYNLSRVLLRGEARSVVVVESFWGVLACVRAGILNAVALMGRSLSQAQEGLLESIPEVVLALDGDEPGRTGTLEIGTRFLQKRRPFRVVYLPEGKQPDLLSEEELRATLAL